MKNISVVGVAFVLGACSTHAVKCHGPLRPINASASSKPSTEIQPQKNHPSGQFRKEPQL